MESKELVAVTEAQNIVSGITNASNEIYCSFPVESKEDRVKLYNITSGTGETIRDNVNKILDVVDVVIIPVDVQNDDGSTALVPRCTLVTKDGRYLSASSWGIYNSLKKIAGIFGGMHFDDPIKMTPIQVQTKNGFTMNLKLV